MITGPSLPKSMALSLVYHPIANSLFNLHHLPPSSSRPCSGLLNRFMSISSSSHGHRLPIFQAMKSSVDLNDQESSNKDSKNTDSKLQMVPSSGNARFSLPNIPVWARWALGALVCLALPFYKRILRIEDGLEKTVDTVVETVEKAAEITEKVAADIANALPEGELKQTVLKVENIAEQVDDGAEKIEEFLDKVEKIEDKVEDLMEPIMEEGKNKEEESKVQNEASPKTDLPKTTSEPNDK